MGKSPFSDDFKRDAVAQITERGYPVAEVADRLGISKHSLYEWKKRFSKPVSVPAEEQGAVAYDEHHRDRVIANLQRRARSVAMSSNP